MGVQEAKYFSKTPLPLSKKYILERLINKPISFYMPYMYHPKKIALIDQAKQIKGTTFGSSYWEVNQKLEKSVFYCTQLSNERHYTDL